MGTLSGTPQPNRPSVAAMDSGELLKGLERETGIETATSSLGSQMKAKKTRN